MKLIFRVMFGVVFSGVITAGCSSDNAPVEVEETTPQEKLLEEEQAVAYLSVKLVDAPGDYQQVNIDLQRLEILMDQSVLPLELIHGGVHDLLEFTGGGYENLVYAYPIPAGNLLALELVLGGDNELVLLDQSRLNLGSPADKQDGLEVALDEQLHSGDTLNLVLDFNIDASIILESDQSYSLVPVLRLTDEDKTGHIYGYLAEALKDSPALIFVTADADTIQTQTYYGEFMLWGLPVGSHDITFSFREGSGLKELIVPKVSVKAGEITAIGPLSYE
ncbi:DUF4382 domain-containing protein [Salegentibacter sp. F14]